MGADRKHFVQSLERGLSVIRAFDADSPELTLSEVARSTGLTRAAARRLLLTLVELGYMRADGRHFQLTPRVLDLGYSYLSSISLPEVAEPHLESLVAEVGESSSVYVARVPTARIMTVAISVGTRFPAYATSMGRVLLGGLGEAELDRYLKALKPSRLSPRTTTVKARLREQIMRAGSRGWAIVDQELEEGLRSAAAAIHDRGGEVIAAVNVSVAAGRTSITKLEGELLPALQVAAGRIEADLRSG